MFVSLTNYTSNIVTNSDQWCPLFTISLISEVQILSIYYIGITNINQYHQLPSDIIDLNRYQFTLSDINQYKPISWYHLVSLDIDN